MILMDEFIAVSNPFDTKNKITNPFQSAGISRPVYYCIAAAVKSLKSFSNRIKNLSIEVHSTVYYRLFASKCLE
jgi:hypothetical protein